MPRQFSDLTAWRAIQLLAACLLVGLTGCEGASAPTLVHVSGKVFFHGRPLSRGVIVFVPDEARGTTGSLACAEIGPDGGYILHTDEKVGAVAGAHRVTIAAVEPAPKTAGPTVAEPRSLLPDKYRDPSRSGLRCDVAPDHDNAVNFHLE